MKSTKQIADILGVSKMTVYRFIKSNDITETSQNGRTLLYDDTSVNLILKGLSVKTDVTDVTPNDTSDFKEDYVIKLEEMNVFLKKEIEDKNNQIESSDYLKPATTITTLRATEEHKIIRREYRK